MYKTFIKFAVTLLVPFISYSPANAQIPDKFQNLQVLPKDISKRELINNMKNATRGLGVRCEFCHVGEGNDLSKFDFPSDDKQHKVKARIMFRMVKYINEEVMPKFAEDPDHQHEVKCITCHNGNEHPDRL